MGFLEVGKIFRLIMQSCCFFLPTFQENFKFLENCPYDFRKILHSHSTLKGAPACAMASKSYYWVVRNIAKVSPKMTKKQPFFDISRFSQKLSILFEQNLVQSFYTVFWSFVCNFKYMAQKDSKTKTTFSTTGDNKSSQKTKN